MVNFPPTTKTQISLHSLAAPNISPPKRAFEKYKPRGLFLEFYGSILAPSYTWLQHYKLKNRQTKLLKTTVHINFILVVLFGIHLLSHSDIYSLYRGKCYVRLWVVFVITRIS